MGEPGRWLRLPADLPDSFAVEALKAVNTFVELAGVAVSVTLVRVGLGILGGPRQTVPRGELVAISSALAIEHPKEWIVVTDRKNHVRGWRDGREATLGTPLGELWEDFWESSSRHPITMLLYTASHRERSLARDLPNGRSPDLFLGNLLADVAAGARAPEAAVPTDIVNGVNRIDAISTIILKRLVAMGISIADVPRAAASLAPIPRPDIKALVAASDHNLKKCETGYRCERCHFTLTRTDLRKGANAACVPPDGLFLGHDGLPVPPPPGHPECARLVERFGYHPSHDLLARYSGGGNLLELRLFFSVAARRRPAP